MSRPARLDTVMVTALFAGSVVYLASLPHNLGFADESYFLYEAKRIRDGEVMYRDVFQYITPLSSYLMAALYWIFGTTMTTARLTIAVVHGVIAVLAYASARALRVRPALAALAALAHLAVSQPAWPFASWHWFSTAIATLIFFLLLRGDWNASRTRLFGLGICCGAFICTQQQRGVMPAAGVGLLVLIATAIDRWYGERRPVNAVAGQLVAYGGGVILIVVPVLAIFAALAGVDAVYDALVRYPTESYRASFRTSWGSIAGLSAGYAASTYPAMLRVLPLVLAIPCTRILFTLVRRRDRARAQQLIALTLFAALSSLSIWYYPDFIHIAFVAVPLFVCVVESIQWTFDSALPTRLARGSSWATGLVVALVLSQHLHTIWSERWARYPYAHETAFGRVDYATRWEPILVDAVRKRLESSPSNELFCYPNLASPYLTTGGKNPTPYQHFFARTFPPRDTARVVATLQERRVPYILALFAVLRPEDPVAEIINRDYQLVALPELAGIEALPAIWLYQRKQENG